MFRSVCRSSLARIVFRVTPNISYAARSSVLTRSTFPKAFTRFASSSNEDDLPDKDVLKVQDVISKLHQHPEIRDLLDEFQKVLLTKGFDPTQQPSFTQVMKLFSDKDVRGLVVRLKDQFEKAGIQISPDDMGLFMKMFKK